MGVRKLRSDVKLQEPLKQKGVKQGMFVCDLCSFFFLTFTKNDLKYPNDLLLYSTAERE